MKKLSKEEAVSLITISEGRKLSIEVEGAKLFEAHSDPFGVVAVIGLKQTGKSTLLNQLIHKEDLFKVEANPHGCTKGIWVYSTSHAK